MPGIIKALEYTYIKEILEEHPDWSCKEVLKESKRLTYGHKWEIFVLNLSFFLWVLAFGFLDNFTFGLASYFLSPYTSMTDVMCYLWLKEIDQTEYVQAELMQNEFLC